MLTTYLKTPLTLARYRIGPAGPHLDRFTEWLEARGYQPARVLHLLRGVHRFSCWAHRAGLPVQGLGAEAIEAFRHQVYTAPRLHYPRGHYSHLLMGARHVVALLAATGQLTAPALIPTGSSAPPLLVEFRHWMSTHRGTTAATVHHYRLPRRDFLAALGAQPTQYTAHALRAFIRERAQRDGSGRAKTVVTAVRMCLRFVIAVGHCAPGLEHAIPTIARWRRAFVPTDRSAEAVERVIASCDRTTPRGLRARAVLRLLARLALRAGDVTALPFRPSDWEGSTVQVAGKSRRHQRVPLPQEVGDAILHDLDYRPTVPTDQVFLTTRAPFTRLSYQAVGTMATPAMARAGTATPLHGAPSLRHAAAPQRRRDGLPLSAIGVVLRHASMETPAGDAQVAVPLLQAVIQPWPAVTSW